MMVCRLEVFVHNDKYICSFIDFRGQTILNRFRTSMTNVVDDIHGKLMAEYDEAPEWWFV